MKNRTACALLTALVLTFSAPALLAQHQGHDHSTMATQKAPATAFGKILDQYYRVHEALANDTTKGVDEAARRIVKLAADAERKGEKGADFKQIGQAASALKGKSLEQARVQFFELSKPILAELDRNQSIGKQGFAYKCTMAKKSWVQAGKEVRNPYYGKSMLKCGEPL